MDQEEGLTTVDNIVTQFNTYEDFLDSQIATVDLFYLEDEGLARQLVELGYRGTGEVVKREDFEARKAAIEIARLAERTQKNIDPSDSKQKNRQILCCLAKGEAGQSWPRLTKERAKLNWLGVILNNGKGWQDDSDEDLSNFDCFPEMMDNTGGDEDVDFPEVDEQMMIHKITMEGEMPDLE